ncbi:MAG TPA: Ig-like domain-containing protein, partial [Burkholderiales bacterium]
GAKPKATNGDDVLVGTSKNDNIAGKKGDDQISGLAGNDKLKGDQGNDLLDGGSGNDRLYGGKGDDRLLGGAGNDVLYGDDGKSKGWGHGWDKFCWWKPRGDYDDYLDGGAGNDRVYGGKGDDVAVYTMAENLGARDDYDGGSGSDTLVLRLTSGEARLASVKHDIAGFEAFLDRHGKHGKEFEFRSFDLDVSNFEELKVELVNTGPTANNDTAATDEDTALVLAAAGLLANDTDPDHLDELRVTGAGASTHGALVTVGAGGAIAYDPTASAALQSLALGMSATDKFSYTIADIAGATSTATVSVTVAGRNDAPVAQDDANATDEDHAVSGDVLLNDDDIDQGDVIHVAAVNGDAANVGATITLASGALLRVNADGSYSYDPNGRFETLAVGQGAGDSFSYLVADNHGAPSGAATVQVAISGANDAPVAADDTAVTDEDTVVQLNLHANDFDIDHGDTLTASPTVFDPREAFQYLAVGESATTTFEYTVTDNHGASDTGAVSITVTGVNDGPDAVDDEATPAAPTVETLFGFQTTALDGYTLSSFNFYPFGLGVGQSPMAYAPTFNDSEPDGADGALRRVDGQNFTLRSLEVAAYFNPHPVTIVGYDDGVQVASVSVDLDPAGPSNGAAGYTSLAFDAAWSSVDDVRFYADNNGDFTFIDNLHVALPSVGNEDTAADIDALANDTDPDASDVVRVDTFDATSAMGAAITQNLDGSFHYDPTAATDVQALAAGQTAVDTFTYVVTDDHGGSDSATVRINLIGVNDLPVAADDAVGAPQPVEMFTGFENTTTVDIGGYVLTWSASSPEKGTGGSWSAVTFIGSDAVAASADTSIERVDGQDFSLLELDIAADLFPRPVTIEGYDNGILIASLTLDLEAAGPSNGAEGYTHLDFGAEWASLDQVRFSAAYEGITDWFLIDNLRVEFGDGNENFALDVDVLGNDTDPDAADVLQVATFDATSAMGAAISLNFDGTLHYEPIDAAAVQALAQGETATDTFQYSVSDGHGGTDTATVSIELVGTNDAPVAADDDNRIIDLRGFENASPSDVGGYSLSGFSINPGLGTGSSWMAYAHTGDDVFEDGADGGVQRADGEDFALLSLDVAAYFTPHLVTISGFDDGVLVASVDVPLGLAGPSAGAEGYTAVSFGSDWGSIDEVRFYADDVNDYTFIDNLRFAVGFRGDEDTPVNLNVLANDSDPDAGDVLSVLDVSASALGAQLTVNDDGTIRYDATAVAAAQALAAGETATDTFTYRVTDGHGGWSSATVTVHVVGVNDAPEALDESFALDEDGEATGNVLANDEDIDSPTLTAVQVAGPEHGTLELSEDGSFVYTPDADYHGSDSFTYVAKDGSLQSNVATVTFTVAPVNDAPVAADDAYNVNPDGGIAVAGPGVLSNDSDVDGDALQAEIGVGPEHGTLAFNLDGSFSYVPDEGFEGEDSFTYSVTDGQAFSDLATVTLTINPENSPPVAADDKASTNEDATVSGNVLTKASGGLDTDVDGDALTVTTTGTFTTTLGASVTLNANGSFTYDPRDSSTLQALNAGQSKVDTFGYEVGDGKGGSDTATVSVTVTGRDEPGQNPKNVAPSTPVGTELDYYIRFQGNEFQGNEWLRLGSFQTELVALSGTGSVSAKVQPDTQAGLGTSSTIIALTKAMTAGTSKTGLESVEIAAVGQDEISGKEMLVDSYIFTNAKLKALGTHADGEGLGNDLSFSFTGFARQTDGLEAEWKGLANNVNVPSPVNSVSQVKPQDLDEGLLPDVPLEYYVRFDGSGLSGQWLELDSFSMALGPGSGASGGGGSKFGTSAITEDAVLVLGSSAQVVELTQWLAESKSSSSVFRFEIEAYALDEQGKHQLVDQFNFDGARVVGVKASDGATNEVTLDFTRFAHGHVEFDPISGGGGQVSEVIIGNFNPPPIHGDVFP